jgi:hypothetical protein
MITAAEARSKRVDMNKILNSISNLISVVSAGQSYLNIEFSGSSPESRFPDLSASQTEVIQDVLAGAGYKCKWTIGSSNRMKLNINW